jgi:hypothetical protein
VKTVKELGEKSPECHEIEPNPPKNRTMHEGDNRSFKMKLEDLLLDTNGKITTQLYDKGDDFNFSIVHFFYLCSNIPSSPA